MKKIIMMSLILALSISLVGCGKGNQITFGGVNKDTDKKT